MESIETNEGAAVIIIIVLGIILGVCIFDIVWEKFFKVESKNKKKLKNNKEKQEKVKEEDSTDKIQQ